ncbi:repeat-containing C domain protein [Orientia tsutsugamushi str. UT144]|uniref:Repeat-containing C domain protein n=1 Tax=Orientia tsutsugamushi str. UT144 TaxID=1441384 RepID=A0A0F3RHY7_ORITS|nr:hypothetical protein [Orientia tsutsugamushi]KJW05878.1 repeat-containing C domain protein [Orientia tsutsugamushi str. UT144]
MAPKRSNPSIKCNLEEYLNQNNEIKTILEKLPEVKRYISNIFKTHLYFSEDFDVFFAKTGNTYTSIENVKLLQQYHIPAVSVASVIQQYTSKPKVLAAILPKLADSRFGLLKHYGIPFSSVSLF